MKKQFILLSTFAAWMLSATFLTSCGEEVQGLANNGNNNETNTESTVGENCTLFSTSTEGTRTSMDTNREFYWSTGDQIYVNTEGATYQMTSESRLAADKARADFVLSGVKLTAPKCSVVYIGNGTNSATAVASGLSVTVRNEQTQTEWGNAEHLGPSGDCGVAEAVKDATGKYLFDLKHKASYLIFQPYKATDITRLWTLMKIEIINENGTTTLAGTYPFSDGKLDVANATSTSDKVTLNLGTEGFELDNAATAAKSCFAVIQPGQHKLRIRYTIKPEIGYWPGSILHFIPGRTFTLDKEIPLRDYNVNGVTTIKHKLGVLVLKDFEYFQWGATKVYEESYPIGGRGEFDETTLAPDELQTTTPFDWTSLPNVNEMYSYLHYGDMHADLETYWTPDDGATVWRNGIWLKKRAYIPEFSDAIGKNGEDMRELASASYNWRSERDYVYKDCWDPNVWDRVITVGLPDESVRDQYFFLPALGVQVGVGGNYQNRGTQGYYWTNNPSSNPHPDHGKANAWGLTISIGNGVAVTDCPRVDGGIFAPTWFQ